MSGSAERIAKTREGETEKEEIPARSGPDSCSIAGKQSRKPGAEAAAVARASALRLRRSASRVARRWLAGVQWRRGKWQSVAE
ncbi:hypothetical protein MRX96_013015 [Rhipicephalus microplus]